MNIQSYSQDGVMYERITDRDDKNELLRKAANGEIVLYAMLLPHTAKLKAYHWAENPKSAERTVTEGLVSLQPKQATGLLGFHNITLKLYPATDPDNESPHPWDDHYFWLEQPQKVTLAQVYCKIDLVESEADESELKDAEITPTDNDDELAALFDPVSRSALSAMFPSKNRNNGDNWTMWHRKAKECGLIIARQKRGKYNPYFAAKWLIDTGRAQLTQEQIFRKLANNLPARSKGSEHLLIGYE